MKFKKKDLKELLRQEEKGAETETGTGTERECERVQMAFKTLEN